MNLLTINPLVLGESVLKVHAQLIIWILLEQAKAQLKVLLSIKFDGLKMSVCATFQHTQLITLARAISDGKVLALRAGWLTSRIRNHLHAILQTNS